MLLFLDTEFTGLNQPASSRKLISLALVAEDGKAEWYGEFDGWSPADCSEWVHQNVLPHLSGHTLPWGQARSSLREWFAGRPRSVKLACDSEIDWTILRQLLDPLPENLAAQRYDLEPLFNSAAYSCAVATYFQAGHPEHHALHDARAFRRGWLAWMDERKERR